MALERRSPFELPLAVHARVRLLARMTSPVRLQVGQPRKVAPAPGECAPVPLSLCRLHDHRLWRNGCYHTSVFLLLLVLPLEMLLLSLPLSLLLLQGCWLLLLCVADVRDVGVRRRRRSQSRSGGGTRPEGDGRREGVVEKGLVVDADGGGVVAVVMLLHLVVVVVVVTRGGRAGGDEGGEGGRRGDGGGGGVMRGGRRGRTGGW